MVFQPELQDAVAEDLEEHKVRVERTIFYNESNSYTVFSCVTLDAEIPEMFVAVGEMPPDIENGEFTLKGEFGVHPDYGEQFVVHSFKKEWPTTLEGIRGFLASGVFPGIGEKRSAAIVSEFGEQTIDVLKSEPYKLAQISGITEEKATELSEIFRAEMQFFEVFAYLHTLGIGIGKATQMYKKYGESCIAIIENNPYALAGEIANIGFARADMIARKLGIAPDDSRRIEAGVLYVLGEALRNGDCYLAERALEEQASNLLDVARDDVSDAILSLAYGAYLKKESRCGENVIYLMRYYEAEQRVAKQLSILALNSENTFCADVDGMIAGAESRGGISLSDEQRSAVRGAIISGASVITGGPGTGKTTVINCIASALTAMGLDVAIAAPTGRAAKRITESSGFPAVTVHRLLEYSYSNDNDFMHFGRDESNPIEADFLIVDECSMIDILLMEALTSALQPSAKILFVGDVNQLPPVGAGNVLRDIISSEVLQVFELTEIFRQLAGSKIIVNAHMINRGEYIDCNDRSSDFYFIHRKNEKDIAETISELCRSRLPAFFPGLDPMKDIQVLTPQRKGLLGCNELNARLQKVMNPPANDREEKNIGGRIFRTGDKVMQIKNNYDMELINAFSFQTERGVFNGDLGFVSMIDDDRHVIHVKFYDERAAEYSYMQLDELEHSYAITIHKSQGSEFPVVIIPINRVAPMLATRNLIYTAVTRGKTSVIMVGDERYLKYMIDNNRMRERNSGLAERLKYTHSLFKEHE